MVDLVKAQELNAGYLRCLSQALVDAGWPQMALAEYLGVGVSKISQILSGASPLTTLRIAGFPADVRRTFWGRVNAEVGMDLPGSLRALATAHEQGHLGFLGLVPSAGPAQRSPDTTRAPSAATGRGSEHTRKARRA